MVGCAPSISHEPIIVEGSAAAKLPMRVIITFSKLPVADSKQLTVVISEACHCAPVFVRQYTDSALIYEVGLVQTRSFAAFEKSLLLKGASLGIQVVELDALVRHQ